MTGCGWRQTKVSLCAKPLTHRGAVRQVFTFDCVPLTSRRGLFLVGTAPATVRFTGHTEFAIGMWIGLELDGFDGRNDGSVQGIRYFSCEAGKGLFKRPTAVAAMTPEEILSNKPPSLAQPATKALQGRSNTGKSGAVQPKSVGSKDQVPVAHQLGCQILVGFRVFFAWTDNGAQINARRA